MITIRRAECPPVLRGRRKKGNLYNNPQVVEALWEMQYQKCCYCETRLPQGGPGAHVDHFRPKSMYARLKNAWHNLLLACGTCNLRKGNKFPVSAANDPLLFDPTDENSDPEDHLEFFVDTDDEMFGLLRERNGSVHGRSTIDTLDLGNSFHVRKRRSRMIELMKYYLEILAAGDDTSRLQAVQRLEQQLGANSEFAAFARDFARAKRLAERFDIRIPRGAEVGG